MSRTSHICLMASYNQWMNAKVYESTKALPEEELGADRKAFFGSILGTLNHLAAGDRVWLAIRPAPGAVFGARADSTTAYARAP